MKRARVVLIGLLALLAMGLNARTQESEPPENQENEFPASYQWEVLRKGEGLSQLLQRKGCNLHWIFEVMTASGINSENLRKLPVGQSVKLPINCKKSPSFETMDLSNSVLMEDMLITQSGRIRVLRKEVSKKELALRKAKAEIVALKAKLAKSAIEAQEVSLRPHAAAKTSSPWWLVLAFLAGVALCAAVWYWRSRTAITDFEYVSEENDLVIKKTIVVTHRGEEITFHLHSYEPAPDKGGTQVAYYGCPACRVPKIEEHNIRRHLDKMHPVRLEVSEELASRAS